MCMHVESRARTRMTLVIRAQILVDIRYNPWVLCPMPFVCSSTSAQVRGARQAQIRESDLRVQLESSIIGGETQRQQQMR